MNTEEILGEFRRKYENTYILSKDSKGELFPCYVKSVEVVGRGNDANGVMHLDSTKFGSLHYTIPSNEAIIFKLPEPKTFQYKRTSVFVERKTVRQWARGICSANTRLLGISLFVARGMGIANKENFGFNLDVISEMYEGKNYSVDQAIQMLSNQEASSIALPNCWSICLSPEAESTDFLLLYKASFVAKINNKKRVTYSHLRACNREIERLLEN